MSGSFTVGDFKPTPKSEERRDGGKPADEMAPAAELSVAEKYAARLAEAGISQEEANAVFDDVMTKGYYQETVYIRGRKAVLRTRSYDDHVRSLTAIETQSPRFQVVQEDLQSRNNLAASLVEWNGVVYKNGKDPDREFGDTLAALRRLPGPVYSLLLAELVKFDAKTFVIFSEGATENF